jgi:hypothetical protein
MRSRIVFLLVSLVVVLAAARPPGAQGAPDIQAGIGFVAVTGAEPGTGVVLLDPGGREVARGTVDRLGSVLFRDLERRRDYIVRLDGAGDGGTRVRVPDLADHPDPALYQRQRLQEGYQYLEVRDGTLLAVMVRPPLGKRLDEGPFPTVVEYSGYSPADPDNPQPTSLIASVLGFATVGVNMRGSGCSGGVLDLFDLPTTADGYDVIETVAAQPWVLHGKVGMVGVSFPGISQIFVAGARPPHLAAVTPMSVIADIYRAPGFPGGIFNNGFAASWLQDRRDDARPAPEGGQAWAIRRVNAGDEICRANQRLRLQTLDPVAFVEANPFYQPEIMDRRSPIHWIHRIRVPMLLAGAWQDEQTGSDFATMLSRVPRRRDVKILVTNGVHATALEPAIFAEWVAFLDLYVARTLPDPGRATFLVPLIAAQVLGPGAPTPPSPPDRFDGITDLAEARRRFESSPLVRVLFENGAGTATPGLPAPTFELGFSRWLPREVRPTAWYLGRNGSLATARPRGAHGAESYRPDPDARPAQTLPGQDQSQSWLLAPDYDWRPFVEGTALAWVTPPLEEAVTIVGPGSVDLWLRSSAEDTDLQVTLSEVRPDGRETYVQSGWLRASHRRLDRRASTVLAPRPTHLERDIRPLPADRFTKLRVPLLPVAHVFRAGSRIRVGLAAPGGDRTRWRFATPATGGAVVNEVAYGGTTPSRVVLPVVRGANPPPASPPCPGLRGQPCRPYVPASNGG